MRQACEIDALHEALALWLVDDDRGALRELLRDARRHGLPIVELAAEVERQEANVVELRR